MTWVKLSDTFHDDPDVDALSMHAVATFAFVLSYCGRHLTDGHIARARVNSLARGRTSATRELLDAGLLVTNGTDQSLLVRNWAKYQPSKASVEKRREAWLHRQHKARGVTP